jgi:protein gp37
MIMKTTKIEWTDKTWNPVTGCSKVSAGCGESANNADYNYLKK